MEQKVLPKTTSRLYKIAFALAIFTIVYNVAEGLLSTYLGWQDETLTLFGFGADSFIETISALGVAHMIIRITRNPDSNRDQFEITALKITGYSFYALCILLTVMAVMDIINHQQPQTTMWGIVISLVSIVIMLGTIYWKTSLGKQLNSPPLIADANCAKVCVYMSVVLLASSLLYQFFKIPYVDIAGTLGIIYFSYFEGKECFEKAAGIHNCSCDHH